MIYVSDFGLANLVGMFLPVEKWKEYHSVYLIFIGSIEEHLIIIMEPLLLTDLIFQFRQGKWFIIIICILPYMLISI